MRSRKIFTVTCGLAWTESKNGLVLSVMIGSGMYSFPSAAVTRIPQQSIQGFGQWLLTKTEFSGWGRLAEGSTDLTRAPELIAHFGIIRMIHPPLTQILFNV